MHTYPPILLLSLLSFTLCVLARSVDLGDCHRLEKRAGGRHSPLAADVMHNNMAKEAEKHWWDVFLSGCGQTRKDEMARQGVPTEEQLAKMRKVEPVSIYDSKYAKK